MSCIWHMAGGCEEWFLAMSGGWKCQNIIIIMKMGLLGRWLGLSFIAVLLQLE
jgi:hypothetical protein